MKPISKPSHEAKESPRVERLEHKYDVELSKRSGSPLPKRQFKARLRKAESRSMSRGR